MVGVKVMVGVCVGVGDFLGVGVDVAVAVAVGVLVLVGVFEGVEVDPSHPCALGVTTMSISTRIVRELDDSIVIGSSGTRGTMGTKIAETETNNR